MTALTFDRPRSTASVFTSVFATTDSVSLLVLRVALGIVILPHGLQKVFGWFGGWGLDGTLGWFASIGIPAFLGILAIAADFAGALALIAGLGTRIAAFGIGVNMIVAALFVHRANGFFMNWAGNQKGEGFEFHILAAAMSLALVLGGAGRWSLDRLLSSRKQ
ncbi:MAG TPA: DoxX family protein [Thermoanaerobaculia bacterium]